MPDQLSSAAEQFDPAVARAEACQRCHDDQDALSAVIVAEAAPDQSERRAELSAWISEQLPDCEPLELAVAACLRIEAEEAAAGFPAFRVDELPSSELKAEIDAYVNEAIAENRTREKVARNKITTGEVDSGVPDKVPAEVGQESTLLQMETSLTTERRDLHGEEHSEQMRRADQLEAKTDKQERNAELIALQPRFLEMLSDGLDTDAALRQVIAEAEHTETKQHLNALLHRVTALTVALPGKAEAIGALLRQAPLDLAATTVAASFDGFVTAVDSSADFTEADRAAIRQVITQTDHLLYTGTRIYEAALATTVDPATGETVPLHPADKSAEVLPGVHAYTETGHNVMLSMQTPRRRVTLDVTGLDGATIGLIAEAMGFQAHLEELKATAFVREVYGVDFGLLGEPSFDPLSLIASRQRLTALMGGAAGYDGEVFDPRDKSGLILAQMRLTSPTDSADGWGQDLHAAQTQIRSLGLHHPQVLEEFGRYTRLHYISGAITLTSLKDHLIDKFPGALKA